MTLIVTEDGQPGGIGRYSLDLATALAPGATLVCLCPDPCGQDCWLGARAAARGIELHQVAMPIRGWRRGLTGLLEVWRAGGRPMVHVNGRRGNFIALAARVIARRFRFVTTAHGVLGLHDRRNRIYRVVDRVASRAARRVIAVCVDTKRLLAAAGVPARRIDVVLNGLADDDLRTYAAIAGARSAAPQDGGVRLGFLGRLSREKGTRELAVVARAVLETHASATFLVAGDGPDATWLTAATQDLAAGGRLRLVGPVADPAELLGAVDILVLPSHNEGLPYVLLEGMASGCAIVAFRVGGIPEAVSDASLGILVPAGDVTSLSRAVVDLAADPARVQRLGAAAARHVQDQFRLVDRVPAYEAIYAGVTPAPGPGRDVPR